jgi:hypothetical protein
METRQLNPKVQIVQPTTRDISAGNVPLYLLHDGNAVAVNWIPSVDNTFDLGTDTFRWGDIYTYNIYIKSQVINYVKDQGSISGALAINFNDAGIHKVTLTGNVTLSFSNATAGSFYTFYIIQDAVGGHAITWPVGSMGAGGSIDLTGTANSVDMISMFVPSSGVYLLAITAGFTTL